MSCRCIPSLSSSQEFFLPAKNKQAKTQPGSEPGANSSSFKQQVRATNFSMAAALQSCLDEFQSNGTPPGSGSLALSHLANDGVDFWRPQPTVVGEQHLDDRVLLPGQLQNHALLWQAQRHMSSLRIQMNGRLSGVLTCQQQLLLKEVQPRLTRLLEDHEMLEQHRLLK